MNIVIQIYWRILKIRPLSALAILVWSTATFSQSSWAVGEIKGTANSHSSTSIGAVVTGALVSLPSQITGGQEFFGFWRDMPQVKGGQVPVILFLHGGTGLGLPAIGEWQRWLATIGIASVAPDSFALPNRLTYKSPVSKEVYEQIHRLRTSEVKPTLEALAQTTWADMSKVFLAGTSEGATSVARWRGNEFRGRIIYAWSCEDNYFVETHDTAPLIEQPVLNIISAVDPFFSKANTWLGNQNAKGHCGESLRVNKRAAVVMVPDAPHTLLNLPSARHATEGFLREALRSLINIVKE